MTKILLKNGRVIDPASNRDEATDLLIEDEKISQIGTIEPTADMEVHELNGKLVMPGAVDLHVHLRDMGQAHKETVKTGTKAALKGGVTTVFAMPNTDPRLDQEEAISTYQTLIKNDAVVYTYIVGAITKNLDGKELADIDVYASKGVRFISDDGFDVNDETLLKSAFEKAGANGLKVITHPEMDDVGQGGVMNEGEVSKKLGVPGQPNEKEWRAVERSIKLALETGTSCHLTHIGTKESVDLVRKAKQQSNLITCDVTPHHIALTDEIVLEKGGLAKVNPPLRAEEDRLALIEAIKDGTVDAIATDHAPHAMDEKTKPLTEAAFGFTGLELMLPVTFNELYHNQGLELLDVVRLLTTGPAKIAGLVAELKVGAPANVVVVDLDQETAVDPSTFESMGKNTPFEGMKLKGWPVQTIFEKNS